LAQAAHKLAEAVYAKTQSEGGSEEAEAEAGQQEGAPENPGRIRELRRTIARILTIRKEEKK